MAMSGLSFALVGRRPSRLDSCVPFRSRLPGSGSRAKVPVCSLFLLFPLLKMQILDPFVDLLHGVRLEPRLTCQLPHLPVLRIFGILDDSQ